MYIFFLTRHIILVQSQHFTVRMVICTNHLTMKDLQKT